MIGRYEWVCMALFCQWKKRPKLQQTFSRLSDNTWTWSAIATVTMTTGTLEGSIGVCTVGVCVTRSVLWTFIHIWELERAQKCLEQLSTITVTYESALQACGKVSMITAFKTFCHFRLQKENRADLHILFHLHGNQCCRSTHMTPECWCMWRLSDKCEFLHCTRQCLKTQRHEHHRRARLNDHGTMRWRTAES